MMHFIKPNWPAPLNVKSYTTLKNSWDSTSRERDNNLINLLSLPNPPIWINQVHGNHVVRAAQHNLLANADACFTDEQNKVCAITTADCLPILITSKDDNQPIIAAIHAGWRGLADSIIECTIAQMKREGKDLIAWIGPGISQLKFEVGEEVYTKFINLNPANSYAFKRNGNNKWLADLVFIAKHQLNMLGINQVFGGDFCTYSQEDMFLSYRRNKGEPKRMATVIWIA